MTEPIFEKITQRWFLTEPALFAVYCTHHLERNTAMKCPLRTGRGVIQYNPALLPEREKEREEMLRCEVLRIMLKHPYERQPRGVSRFVLGFASDLVLVDHVDFARSYFPVTFRLGLPSDMYYEWYANELAKLLGDDTSRASKSMSATELEEAEEKTELWDEDEFMASTVTETLRDVRNWGSVPSRLVDHIKANMQAKIDYRKALQGFRTSVISALRSLTRMRPSRRHGFRQMGSKYELEANLLIAVDVSGSVSRNDMQNFFGIILSFFKYGVTRLNVLQFDAEIKGEPLQFDKSFNADKEIEIVGRGGTDFQAIFDYLKEHNQYDGLIIFTDGYAAPPKLDFLSRTKVLWVCQNEKTYNEHHAWMEQTGRACFIQGC
ncbi:MAG: hypothetical protein HUK14_10790 [Muribaculaceae bacterium]|nr:hypothetical protein [Muribaculaceae bacterium]